METKCGPSISRMKMKGASWLPLWFHRVFRCTIFQWFNLLIKLRWSSQEVRAVERRILLETLANQLPSDSVSFSSRLVNIQREENGETKLQLQDGSELSAKVAWLASFFSWNCCIPYSSYSIQRSDISPGGDRLWWNRVSSGEVDGISRAQIRWSLCFSWPRIFSWRAAI